MSSRLTVPQSLRTLTADGRLLFVTRMTRLFAYGFLAVVLVLYLKQVGLSDAQIGLLLSLTLAGDVAVSLWITTNADRIGRKRMLIIGAGLMLFASIAVCLHQQLPAADYRGDHWRHQPKRQRDRPISVHRAGHAVANRSE